MSQRGLEISVGIFVLIGILAFGYLSIQLGQLDFFAGPAYTVQARFTTVTGLRPGAPVELAGVEIGKVRKISLEGEDAVVTLRLHENIKLSSDAIASIRTKGILGDKYIQITQGGSEKTIPPGGLIRETVPPVDLERLIGDFIFRKNK